MSLDVPVGLATPAMPCASLPDTVELEQVETSTAQARKSLGQPPKELGFRQTLQSCTHLLRSVPWGFLLGEHVSDATLRIGKGG